MIRFTDLATQNARLRSELDAAIGEVIDHSDFVLGSAVASFEEEFARYCGATSALGTNSGTSALHLALLAAGVGPGDEVITTAFTFVATVAAIGYTGARPVLVDITPESFTLDATRIERLITPRTRAIVPVHLYGQAADMDAILAVARRHGLAVIEDACQAHGATYRGRRVGTLGDAGCFSFYPSKNLGALGEGGMVVTSDPAIAAQVQSRRNWGQTTPYQHNQQGFNYRMEGIQGAVLRVKLRHLEQWNRARQANAAQYDAALQDSAITPPAVMPGNEHVYHIYAVRTASRPALQAALLESGIETRVHYPAPIHLLEAWRALGYSQGSFPEAERAAAEVLSIPVHPDLSTEQVTRVAHALEAHSHSSVAAALPRPRSRRAAV